MATIPIKVPSVGESVTEGILSRWLKANGAAVKQGEPLFELETDKASQEVRAEADGTLAIREPEGSTVAIGATVGILDTEAAPRAAEAPAPAPPPASAPAPAPSPASGPAPAPARPGHDGASAAGRPASEPPASPAVRRIAAEEKVDLSQVAGTGPGGRVLKGDVIAHLEAPPAPPAREPAAPRPAPAPPASSAPAPAGARRETRQRMSGIRQKIAQRLVEAQHTAAILTTFNEADLSRVIALRKQYKERFEKTHGVGLGFMGFFVKAAVEALKAFPKVNATIDGADLVLHHFHDIGVAVSTERGLMVPVLRDADRMRFAEIEKAIADFAKRARDNTIAVSDLQGGTFTITNGGVFGSLLSTPILNPPQSAILGMHKIQERPVVVDGQIVARPMMYLALSYDHRIIDGREAVSFLVRIKECVEDPERLLLEV
jgi:2-oxoglutarate dehydrogenase E2 component (dihydrolipoamide succinyltransferase)